MSDTSASASTPALTVRAAALLLVPPVLWAGNAITGRLVHELISPLTLNFFRWGLALLLLLPIAYKVLQRNSALWSKWKRFAVLGFLGVGCYNSFQYLALQTSSPINVTLVASSTPVFMLAIGAIFFNQTIRWHQVIGAALSIAGVLLVLCRGDWNALANVQWVIGDIYVLIATACWGFYSWLLTRPDDPAEIRSNWAYFLMAQMAFGLSWSGLFTTGEWLAGDAYVVWSWPLAAALAYVALCPSLLAYRCWGLGVQQAGPNIAGFFANLTPLFAAVMSALVLGDLPQTFHAAAFALIVGGIVVSSLNQNEPE
ncbi:MAG: DMT family transporter [Burkholderiales bacterium]|nr:DMT family transporter [Burkholderiales bacterium]